MRQLWAWTRRPDHDESKPASMSEYAIAAIFLVFMIQYAVSVANQIAPIPFSDFQRLLHESKIATVGVSDRFMEGS